MTIVTSETTMVVFSVATAVPAHTDLDGILDDMRDAADDNAEAYEYETSPAFRRGWQMFHEGRPEPQGAKAAEVAEGWRAAMYAECDIRNIEREHEDDDLPTIWWDDDEIGQYEFEQRMWW